MATREQKYRAQMKALGIYDPAFEPELTTLCQLEREHQAAKKAWSATAPAGGKPSVLDPHYEIIQKQRAEMLRHRESLGLTPKALQKLKGAYYETLRVGELVQDPPSDNVTVLDLIREKFAL